MSLAQGVAAYRREYLIEQGFGRLKGRTLSLTPLCLQYDHRGVGWRCRLRLALRVLGLRQCLVRCNLRQEGATLTGISPGQPGRQTTQPTTEMRLSAFRGVTLARIKIDSPLHECRTPVQDGQKCILALMELPLET